MPAFDITVKEIWTWTVRVQGATAAEALAELDQRVSASEENGADPARLFAIRRQHAETLPADEWTVKPV